MITVNSLSGGKTSSYVAVHYPADLEIFSLVCIDCHNAAGRLKKDKKLMQMVNDKLERFIPMYGEFKATAEAYETVKVMFDLEQYIGREIKWVRGESFEHVMNKRNAIPNVGLRFCTYEMKIKPIFEYLYLYHELPVQMRIGYRYDEKERADTFTTSIRHPFYGQMYTPEEAAAITNVVIKSSLKWNDKGGYYYLHRSKEFEYRVGEFVLIDDVIFDFHIKDYWSPDKGLVFPKDSNCQNCFWKQPAQLRKNFDTSPSIMQWASLQEIMRDRSWKKGISYENIKRQGIQTGFSFGGGAGCQAGFCTD